MALTCNTVLRTIRRRPSRIGARSPGIPALWRQAEFVGETLVGEDVAGATRAVFGVGITGVVPFGYAAVGVVTCFLLLCYAVFEKCGADEQPGERGTRGDHGRVFFLFSRDYLFSPLFSLFFFAVQSRRVADDTEKGAPSAGTPWRLWSDLLKKATDPREQTKKRKRTKTTRDPKRKTIVCAPELGSFWPPTACA